MFTKGTCFFSITEIYCEPVFRQGPNYKLEHCLFGRLIPISLFLKFLFFKTPTNRRFVFFFSRKRHDGKEPNRGLVVRKDQRKRIPGKPLYVSGIGVCGIWWNSPRITSRFPSTKQNCQDDYHPRNSKYEYPKMMLWTRYIASNSF